MRKVKKFDDSARIMGLDVGRKYTGVGMSDKDLKVSVPLRTLFSDAQYTKTSVNLAKYDPMFWELQKIIRRKNVKGIVVGYPLDVNGQPQLHCNFIERWVEHMWYIGVARKTPVTLVNEYNSTMVAKTHIAEAIQRSVGHRE